MNNIEKEFKKYFIEESEDKTIKQIAHELAEIAKKDCGEKEAEYLEEIQGRDGIISKVIDERDALKKQLSEQKYLDYKEVEKIFGDLNNTVDDIITAICNLPYKSLTRDKIIKVLKANRDSYVINDDMKIKDPIILEENFEKIATEILEGKEGEE